MNRICQTVAGRRLAQIPLAALWLMTSSCEEQPREPPPVKLDGPSVLLITLDTTRADHLSCYGYQQQTSRNLDRLARSGTLFLQALSQAAVTPVSHASIMTGLNPYNHGLRVMHGLAENRLAESCTTLAEVLHDVGYQTAALVSSFPVTGRFGFDQGFDRFDADFMKVPAKKLISPGGTVNTGRNQRRADATTDRALTWLAAAREPFFVWMHYFDPHDPHLRPPHVDSSKFSGRVVDVLRELYDLEIRFMDEQIGRLLDELERTGRLEKMVVVVVADHGEGLGDHDWWTHGILYQEQIRVPLIIRAPAKPANQRIDQIVRSIDIMPTVLELVGLDPDRMPPSDGRSLVPLLSGRELATTDSAYSDSVNMLTYGFFKGIRDVKDDMLFCVVDGRWKYIHHLLRTDESELYDLSNDPGEQRNLFGLRPDQVERLRGELRAWDYAPDPGSQRGRMSPEDVERLRSLGYVD